ncbi:MAG TPA: hypothetical protein VIL74_11115 [Pyrinomonadaceae bacterium]|jgi:hypothetical protein
MSGFFGILLIVGILTLLGAGTLLFITLKYYWGERGTPPLKREQRRQALEEELRWRAKQIEYSKTHPIATRSSSFWDNTKVYR